MPSVLWVHIRHVHICPGLLSYYCQAAKQDRYRLIPAKQRLNKGRRPCSHRGALTDHEEALRRKYKRSQQPVWRHGHTELITARASATAAHCKMLLSSGLSLGLCIVGVQKCVWQTRGTTANWTHLPQVLTDISFLTVSEWCFPMPRVPLPVSISPLCLSPCV